MKSVLLVNMPFGSTHYPSLALGLFQARLRADGVPCDVQYLNVLFARMVGWDTYDLVGNYSALLAGEQLFARSLFGDRVPSSEAYHEEIRPLVSPDIEHRLSWMRSQVEPFLAECLRTVPWDQYDVIGFTSLFEQQVPSLSLANRLKQRFPEKVIAFGGANCEDLMGRTLHQYFPFIDHVCTGEGDKAFPELIRRIQAGESTHDVPGITARRGNRLVANGHPTKPRSMDDLPYPNYDGFFEALKQWEAPSSHRPTVLMETSRGCWWGAKVMCTFCGLNGTNIAFREKSPERALAEAKYLASSYDVHMIRTVDNIMPESYTAELLPALAREELGVEFFYELRAVMAKDDVRALRDARVTSVQAGIEQINTHILKLMRKGTTALGNIEFLKWCRQYGVHVDWNLLFGFPGETVEDYRVVYERAQLITHLTPPTSVGRIRLDRFSENFNNAEERGFINVRPWHMYRFVYPFSNEVLADMVYYFDFDYAEPLDDEGFLLKLGEQMAEWGRGHDRLTSEETSRGLVIRDTRGVGTEHHRLLEGTAAQLYSLCDSRRTTSQAQEALARNGVSVDAKAIRTLLDALVEDRLMMEENGKYLSLAVPVSRIHAQEPARPGRVYSAQTR